MGIIERFLKNFREYKKQKRHVSVHPLSRESYSNRPPHREESLQPGTPYVPDQKETFGVPPKEEEKNNYFREGIEELWRIHEEESENNVDEKFHNSHSERDSYNTAESAKPNPWRQRITYVVLLLAFIFIVLKVVPLPFGKVEVKGNTSITAYSLVETNLIKAPVNILQINKKALKENLESDLRVASVKMNYSFPATLEIYIEKRVPVAVVMTQFGYGSIDENNRCIELSSTLPDNSAPVISGIKVGTLLLGEEIKNSKIKSGIDYLQHLTEEERKNISEVNVGDNKNINAYTVDGLKMHLGDEEGMPEKAKLSMQMLKDVRTKKMKIEYMDVNLNAPIFKIQK